MPPLRSLSLPANDLHQQQLFYEGIMGLPLLEKTANAITLGVGSSRLTFYKADDFKGPYHFAIDVASNHLQAMQQWANHRFRLLSEAEDKTTYFHSENWNADQVYFFDTDGNIVELIARHTRQIESPIPFKPETAWLNLSEIGIAVPDVPQVVEALGKALGWSPYLGSVGETFCALGDHDGLLILVQEGRMWFPERVQPAPYLPLTVQLQAVSGETITLSTPPYPYQVSPLEE